MKVRRILATTAAAGVFSTVALASPAIANEPVEGYHPPVMTGNQELSVQRGIDARVSIGVFSQTELQNVHIIVEENKNGTEVTYPGNGSSAGLTQGATLLQGGLDRAKRQAVDQRRIIGQVRA
jgi:hypothetical protein